MAPLIRLEVAPNDTNGLRAPSRLMVDKITTVPRASMGARIGNLATVDLARLERAMMVFLGLAA
ncbi:MAG: type II toxin-antitoxin system PemK/MazF family toxin [Rhodospirillales bacterium]